jgi:hypothetical protein
MSIGFSIKNIAFLPIVSLWRKDYAHTCVSIEKRDFFIVFRSNIWNLLIEIWIEASTPYTLIRQCMEAAGWLQVQNAPA